MSQTSFIKAGVIGHPVAHSKSPLIHQHWIEKYGLLGSYERIDIAPEKLLVEIRRLADDGYAGFNVTLPHKQAMLGMCDDIDDLARAIGAVNTVSIRDGKFYGTNTDAFGFLENIRHAVPDFEFTGKMAIVLGAGGAARAVLHALLKAGIKQIILCNRTAAAAESLAVMDAAKITIADWQDRSKTLADANLLINTTSLGMTGKEALDIDLAGMTSTTLVNDIVYVPLMTDLLRQSENKGCRIVTGIGMLLHQARPAFEQWFGVLPEVDRDLQQKVLA